MKGIKLKRGTAIVIVLTLVFSLAAACGGGNATTEPENPTENFGEFRWPRSAIAQALPTPKSTFGNINWEDASGFYVEVGNTSNEDFNAYIDECWERGFTLEYNKGNDFFWADHQDGYHVDIRHDGANIMTIWAMTRNNETESELTPEPTPTPEPQDNGDNQDGNDNVGGAENPVTPDYDWRQFLIDYEEWMDDYIAFLKKYEADPTNLELLTESLDLMIKAAEWAERAEEIETDLENDPDALKEYLEVLTRILKKLTDAM